MTTEAITTTSIPAHRLAEALAQVAPHLSTREHEIGIAAVHFDSDGTFLHMVATDRYTIAVARRQLHSGTAWTATVGGMHVTYLQSWAEAHNYRDTVQLTAAPGQLTVTSNQGRIVLPALDSKFPFPAWRPLFRKYLTEPTEPVDVSGLDAQYLRRWEAAGRHLEVSQPGPNKPLLIAGEDFLGMQMPLRLTHGQRATRAELAARWAPTLGTAADTAAELPLPDPKDTTPETTEGLLRQVLISSQELYEACSGDDSAAMGAHARSGAHAWMAYRLLQVLQVIDPRTTRIALGDLLGELDGGEFAETAYDAAEKLGHDPDQWIADYKAACARRAQAAEQPAPEAPATG